MAKRINPIEPNAISVTLGRFCVYFLFSGDGSLVYIGSGSLGRAQQSFCEKRASSVQVIWTDSRDDAYSLEAEMIKKHEPPMNVFIPSHNGRPSVRIKRIQNDSVTA